MTKTCYQSAQEAWPRCCTCSMPCARRCSDGSSTHIEQQVFFGCLKIKGSAWIRSWSSTFSAFSASFFASHHPLERGNSHVGPLASVGQPAVGAIQLSRDHVLCKTEQMLFTQSQVKCLPSPDACTNVSAWDSYRPKHLKNTIYTHRVHVVLCSNVAIELLRFCFTAHLEERFVLLLLCLCRPHSRLHVVHLLSKDILEP